MIVIDASALAKYVLEEDNWKLVARVMRAKTYSLDLAVKEVANAIWKKAVVLKVEPPEIAARRYRILRMLIDNGIIELESELDYIDDAFDLAIETGLTVYDALYIAQAAKKKAVLVTSDKKQAKTAQELGLTVNFIP